VLAIGGAAGILLTLLSAITFGRRIVGRLERLAASARRVQEGESLPAVIEGRDEIAELDRTYHNMAVAVREREAQLQKYGLLSQHARDVILFIHRSEGRIVEANAAAAQAYGYSIDELSGMRAADLRAPETAPLLDVDLERADESPIVFETVHRRKDGSTFPVEIAAQGAVVNGESLMLEIVRDITERRMAQQELQAALKQTVKASRLKSEFLATMSHEIRTPLNAVIGMTELLLHSGLSEEQERCAAIAHESGESLLHLINDILDFSKIEAQGVELEIVDFNLVMLVEGVAGLFAPQAARGGVELMTYINPWIPQKLLGDPGRLRQVLVNLTGNAVKFTQRGAILVSADLQHRDADAAEVAFSIKDSGIGIAPEALAGLFEPFRQADGSMSRRYGGTGLGLSISKGIVELMGGSIAVQSVAGAGSTFSFTLHFKNPRPDAAEPPNLGGMRALIVDDDPVSQDVLKRYLTSWRMRCDATADPLEACRMVEAAAKSADPYDVVLVDLVMPQMDGFTFAHRLQSTVDLSHTRLIMVTGHDAPERGKSAIAAGFSAYLTKPVRQSQLFDCIVNAAAQTNRIDVSQTLTTQQNRDAARILLAEDNAINREVAMRQLETLGYAAEAVPDGRAAVEAALTGRFDIILMDCQMPEMDGFEATRAIRKGEARSGKRVRIIALTANALAEDRQACLDAGMDDYLAKPITLQALRGVLRSSAPPPLDFDRLNELFESDTKAIRAFLDTTLPALLRLVERIQAAVTVSEQIAAAHELKGAAANVGASEIARITAELEERLRRSDERGETAAYISRLHEAYERAAAAQPDGSSS
jgi:two-component system sensor histidine kinase/response regulator